MGYSSYNTSARATRSDSLGYSNVETSHEAFLKNFKQQSLRKINEGMDPNGVTFRESRDSESHPLTVPIQLWLDVTGSMGSVPKQLISSGLPTLISTLIERGVNSPALMFGAIGDHLADNYPLQVAQYESGDFELDDWLTKTYIEGNGGGNGGESYSLAWYFSAYHTVADSFTKRGKKGYLFTIGDEPNHQLLHTSRIRDLMGDTANPTESIGYNDIELLDAAKEANHVYHIHLNKEGRRPSHPRWRELLGNNLIEVKDYKEIPNVIAELILSNELSTESSFDHNVPDTAENNPDRRI
jgi:hypothetical protein